MKFILFILIAIIDINYCFADSLNENVGLEQLFSQNENNRQTVLNQKFTINKSFSNIYEVAQTVSKITNMQTKIINESADKVNLTIINQSNGTVSSFLNKACQKFHYSWKLTDNFIVFSAINVLQPKSTPIANTQTKLNKMPIILPWILDTKAKTLRNVLTLWSKRAGWQLVWNVKADYPILTAWSINGTFEEAINEILKASQQTDTPLMAKMHDSNHVLEVYSVIK